MVDTFGIKQTKTEIDRDIVKNKKGENAPASSPNIYLLYVLFRKLLDSSPTLIA